MNKQKIIQEDMERIARVLPDAKNFNNKSILVTGANGMLAAYLVRFFIYLNEVKGAGIKVYALSRNGGSLKDKFGYAMDRGWVIPMAQSVTDKMTVGGELDYIFHLAGMADPMSIKTDPVGIIRANVQGTMNVLELAREKGALVVFASTREVYGAMPEGTSLIREEDAGSLDPADSRSCYPESKRLAETLLVGYHNQYYVNFINTRIAHAYGPGMRLENDGRVMADFLSDAVAGRDIVLKSAGTDLRAFCYVSDAISGLLTAALRGEKNRSYNLANETEEISIRGLAELCAEFSPADIGCTFDEGADQSGYVKFKRVALDTSRLEALGWKPEVSLRDGIKRTIEFFG